MPTTPLPSHLTKISYILPKKDKARLERAAKELGVSMSTYITQVLTAAQELSKKPAPKKAGRAA